MDEPTVEEGVDALEGGDRTVRAGTAMAALRHDTFRRVFTGAFLSNIGSWMQNVVLGALAYDLTGSPTFVGVLLFAQLGPLLLFSLVGGLLADVFDRRRLLIVIAVLQGLLSVLLALVCRGDDPSRVALVVIVFGIGMGQAVFGPTYSALLPARRALVIIFLFSLLSLPFIGQLPTLADRNLGIDSRSVQYGLLYTCFGAGALLGALSIGTVFANRSMEQVVRGGLMCFAGALALFSVLRSPAPAYAVILLVGLAYFAVITSLSTVLQQRLDEQNRGRVMALWIMGFGGTVPIGNLVAGPLIELTSVTTVVLAGAAIAVALAAYTDLRELAPTPARQ